MSKRENLKHASELVRELGLTGEELYAYEHLQELRPKVARMAKAYGIAPEIAFAMVFDWSWQEDIVKTHLELLKALSAPKEKE